MLSISFQTFFVQAFKIVIDSWKFSILLLYILWDDWPIFMISDSNEQLQQQLEYTLLKPDCHCWWISKMQSGREDTLQERYAIKFCFKLGKNATEIYEMLEHLSWIDNPFLSGIRDSRTAGSLWGIMRGVGEVRKSIRPELIGQRLGLLCWGHWQAYTRGLPWGLPEVVETVQQESCSRRRLLRRGLEFHVCTINKSAHTKIVWKLI